MPWVMGNVVDSSISTVLGFIVVAGCDLLMPRCHVFHALVALEAPNPPDTMVGINADIGYILPRKPATSTVLKKQRHPCLLEVWTAPCNGWNQLIVDWCNHSCWWNQLIAGGLLDIRNLNGWKCCLKPGFLTRKPGFLTRKPRISGQLCP